MGDYSRVHLYRNANKTELDVEVSMSQIGLSHFYYIMAFRFQPSLLATRSVRTSFNAQQYLASTTRRIQPAFALQSLRCRSTAGNGAQSGAAETRTITIPTLPKVLIGLALACLTVGLYEYLVSDIQKYPPDIRQALRKALYYQHNGKDLNSSVKYFREALQLALESSEMERDGAPLTGIMIQLGALLESMGRLPEARQTLTLALRHLAGFENDRDSPSNKPDSAFFDLDVGQLPPATQKKLVGIAQKLGDINASMKRDEDAEKWYTWSVEHLLKISSKPVLPYGDSDQIIFDKEHMPKWLTETEMGAALEALGGFYAERNKPRLAAAAVF